jgi:tetratricopeptide (TPR) repeat protein
MLHFIRPTPIPKQKGMNMKTKLTLITLGLLLATLPAAADFETGLSHFKAGKYMEAAAEFQKLVDDNPDYADGYHLVGVCFLKTKKYDDAEKNFLKALELNGDKFEYHFNLANTYAAQKKHGSVVKTLNNAEGLAPATHKAALHKMRGHALYSQKKFGEAIDDLERALAGKPDAATQAQLGKAYFSVGEYPKAVSSLKKAVGSQPTDGNFEILVESLLSMAAKASGESAKKLEYGKAMSEADKWAAASSSSKAKYAVARSAFGAGQLDKAVANFDAVIQADSKNCNAMANLGKAYVSKADWNNALKALDKAIQCDPQLNIAWESKGFALQKQASEAKDPATTQSKYNQAIAAYQKALAIKNSPAIQRAIDTCNQNIQISKENQGIDAKEAQQDAEIKAEEERVAAEEAKRKAWEDKDDD